MTKEELLSKQNLSLTMKQLREFVNKNTDIKDEAPVLIERVEDVYFEGVGFKSEGWDLLKVKGFQYHSQLCMNNNMQEEINRRERGEEPEYDMEDPSVYILPENELGELLEEFYIPYCITTDKEIVYIYSHY